MFAAVTNTRGYGGGFLISPGASVTDGALDLCIVARSGRLALLSKFAHILRGTHAGLPRVTLAQSPWVTIEDLRARTCRAARRPRSTASCPTAPRRCASNARRAGWR